MVEPYVDAPPWVRYRYNQAAPGMNFDTVSRINAELGPPSFRPYTGYTSGPTGYSWGDIQAIRNPTYTPSNFNPTVNGPTNLPYGSAAPGAELGPSSLPAPPPAPAGPGPFSALRTLGSQGTGLEVPGPSFLNANVPKTGFINALAGNQTYWLGSHLGQVLNRDTNSPLGRILGETLHGAGANTAVLGPVPGVVGGLTQGAAQAGFESGKGNLNLPANAYLSTLSNTPIVGSAIQAGQMLGTLNNVVPDWAKDYVSPSGVAKKIAGLIPGMGGGDSGSGEQAAATQAQQDAARNEANQKLRDSTTPTALAATTFRAGITGPYSQALIDDFNNQVQLGLINVENGVKQDFIKTDKDGNPIYKKGMDENSPTTDENGKPINVYETESRVPTREDIIKGAHDQFLAALPAVQAQQAQDNQSNLQAAAMQQAIAQYMPQVAAPGQAALNAIGSQLLGSVPGLAPGMQQAALNYATTGLNAADTYNTALTNSLAFIPQQMQQDAAAKQQQAYDNTVSGMLNSARALQFLQQTQPQLFPKKSSGGGSPEDLYVNAIQPGG